MYKNERYVHSMKLSNHDSNVVDKPTEAVVKL